jgi:AcrR family transcriptional regulator
MAAPTRERIRDAGRSRLAILAAAERLFAQRGYEGTSMSDIGATAGLSRGAPGYFFGAKERLYAEVLTRVFEQRQQATARAFVPVHEWCAGSVGTEALARALGGAAEGYMRYLAEHPSFVALIVREELDGGGRLEGTSRHSTAMQDAFRAVRRAGAARGVRPFRVADAVLLFIALTFAPFSYRNTLMRAVGRDMSSTRGRRQQAAFAVDQLMGLLCG